MSRHADALARASTDVDQVLRPVERGTPDSSRRVKRVDLAVEHARAWAAMYPPPANLGERGGSSSPAEVEDRVHEARIARVVHGDIAELEEIPRRMARDAHRLYLLVARYTETVHPDKLPSDAVVPGCRSCARPQRGTPRGYFAAVREDALRHGLCDWCYRHALAAAAGGEITVSCWPVLEAVDRFHREGPQAAGRWLAKQRKGAA